MTDISICIPVYGTESYLKNCLESVANQTFKNYEVIIVNDFSSGVDEAGCNCKRIVKEFKKKHKISINYMEHSRNLGVLEARRSAVEAAKGNYICMLDSDDTLLPNSLDCLYSAALRYNYDIIHGLANVISSCNFPENKSDDENILKIKKSVANVFDGNLNYREIFRGFLVNKNHCGFLWAKLIKRDVYLEAFSHIPPMFCVMADDIIQYFWISYFAKSYCGLNENVYNYFVDTGISSKKIIKSLSKWEHVCSASSVFTAIFSELENSGFVLSDDENDSLVSNYYNYIGNNLIQWKMSVDDKLKDDAYNMLCDFWGRDIVLQVYNEFIKRGIF